MYIYPCKNEGKCRQLEFQKMGLAWYESYPKHGVVQVRIDSKFGFEKFVGRYKCCTQCHLPLNRTESIKANKLHGYTLEEEPEDTEFLELLNAIE